MAEPCFAWTAGTHASIGEEDDEIGQAGASSTAATVLHQKSVLKLAWIPLFSGMTGCGEADGAPTRWPWGRGALGLAHERDIASHPHCRTDGERQVGLAMLRLAEHLGAVVINADSMQVYRGAAHSDRPSASRRKRASRTRSMASCRAARAIRPGATRPTYRACSKMRAAKTAVRSSSAAPASTSRRSLRGCRPSRRCRRTCARARVRAATAKRRRPPARGARGAR